MLSCAAGTEHEALFHPHGLFWIRYLVIMIFTWQARPLDASGSFFVAGAVFHNLD